MRHRLQVYVTEEQENHIKKIAARYSLEANVSALLRKWVLEKLEEDKRCTRTERETADLLESAFTNNEAEAE